MFRRWFAVSYDVPCELEHGSREEKAYMAGFRTAVGEIMIWAIFDPKTRTYTIHENALDEVLSDAKN